MSTTAIFGSYVLTRKDGAQDVLRDHGVLVEGRRIAAITPSSAPDRAGLRRGNVINKIDDTEVPSGESLVGLIRSFKAGQKATISYIRGSQEATVDVTMGTAKS